MSNETITGYPSIDKPWLKYYKSGAEDMAKNIPLNKTVWDIIENKLKEQCDAVPAIEYFGRKISRSKFIKQVYAWAKVFKQIGVREDEVVCVYSPWFSEIAYILLALNMIGAVSYCLKLAISKEALKDETAKSRFAVVFDGMWENVKPVFEGDRFEKIFIVSPSHSMSFPQKQLVSLAGKKSSPHFPRTSKYIFADKAIKRFSDYSGNLRAQFKPNRAAFITSSSGTTIDGVVKGIMTTNEAAIAQCLIAEAAENRYYPGRTTLTNLPPTASTALCCLYLYPLYFNMTMIIEPRMNEDIFFDQVIKYKPNVVIITGALWTKFFKETEKTIKSGNTPNLSFFDMAIIGGEGVNPEDFAWLNKLMKQCGSEYPMFHGYGLSEEFSVISVDKANAFNDINFEKDVVDVGVPYPGITVGIFDEYGNELGYNQRGELCIKSNTAMKGYFEKPELTEKAFRNGWLRTGDLFEIDENGFLYCYGRLSDKLTLPGNKTLYLFDIANELCKDTNVKYAMVNCMGRKDGIYVLAAHLVLHDTDKDAENIIKILDKKIIDFLPAGVSIAGYKVHSCGFRVSPTTAKKDRNYYAQQLSGYVKPTETGLAKVDFNEL